MIRRCTDHRARALDFVLGDLPALENARMEAHVARCDECRALCARLSHAFDAAKRWPPESSPADLEHLIARLEPHFAPDGASRARISGFGVAILAAAAVTAAIVVGASYTKDQVLVAPLPAPIAVREEPQPDPPPQPSTEIVRLKPKPFVKVVAGRGWDGKIAGETPHATSIVMSRGFAMIDFEGGKGRKLWVGAPNASVEVVGTRFFVDAAADGLTTVGVISGKVVVDTPNGTRAITAGQRWSFGQVATHETTARSDAENFAEDPFLGKHRVHKPAQKKDPLAELALAERLVRENQPKAALEKYDALIAQLDAEHGLLPLVRYERARLYAFSLGDKSRGERELRAVADAGIGEASLQAKLSLCELRLADDPCSAAQCLEHLRAREHSAISAEIDRLFPRWRRTCDHK